MDAKVHAVCPVCASPRVAHFRLDSDWGYGGDWSQVNADDAYTEFDLANFRDNQRDDIECHVCCQCGACFDRPLLANCGGTP
jgi:hypothetical protein